MLLCRGQLQSASGCKIFSLCWLVTLGCFLLFGRFVVSLTHSPFPFSILRSWKWVKDRKGRITFFKKWLSSTIHKISKHYHNRRCTCSINICIYICKTQIDVQSSNRHPILKSTFNMTSLMYTPKYVTPVRTWFWNNDGEGNFQSTLYILL